MRLRKGIITMWLVLFTGIQGLQAEDFNSLFLRFSLTPKSHSPHLASVLSAVLPGAGQIYNKKYWKVPIIYAGLGALSYSIIKNQQSFRAYQNELIARSNKDTAAMNMNYAVYPDEYLRSNRDYFRNNRDLSIIGVALIYTLNIVDAAVDAHLYNFDVNKSLSIKPKITPQQTVVSTDFGLGMGLVFRF